MDRHPEIRRRRFCHERLDGLYSEVFGEKELPALILNPGLSCTGKDALLAGTRYYAGRVHRVGRKFCYAPVPAEEMAHEHIRALQRCIIGAKRPDRFGVIRIATLVDTETYTIVYLSGVLPYPAVAILENIKARGELPNV